MYYFTSDTNFSSRFIDRSRSSELISNINKVVHENDVLFHLGNFAKFSSDFKKFRNRINCKTIHLILSLEDESKLRFRDMSLFNSVTHRKIITDMISNNNIILTYYEFANTIENYNVIHGGITNINLSKRPLSLEEILKHVKY